LTLTKGNARLERFNNRRWKVPISEILLEKLVCPLFKVKVELKVELKSGNSGLKCPQCNRVYPVHDELPVMLPDEASIEGAA
jgi:uncharacterized protein YbaR (Trm112 family)